MPCPFACPCYSVTQEVSSDTLTVVLSRRWVHGLLADKPPSVPDTLADTRAGARPGARPLEASGLTALPLIRSGIPALLASDLVAAALGVSAAVCSYLSPSCSLRPLIHLESEWGTARGHCLAC